MENVVSQTPALPLAETIKAFSSSSSSSPSKDIIMKDDENDSYSETDAVSAETTEGTTSTMSNESRSEYDINGDFGEDDDDVADDDNDHDHNTIPKDNEGKQRQLFLICRNYSSLRNILFEKNTVTLVLIPTTLAYAFFGKFSSPSSLEAEMAITSFFSKLIHDLSRRYMQALEEYPVFTKSMTTGIIQFFGDYAAQCYEHQRLQKQKNNKKESGIHHSKHNNDNDNNNKNNNGYDLRRGLSLFADGLFLSGPLLHYCFEYMEEVWPTSEAEDQQVTGTLLARPLATLCHVFVNDYIIDSIYIALSFVFTGIVEGYAWKEVGEILRKDFVATVKASWLTSLALIPVEILCFGYLSLTFRVLAMNFVDLFWGAIVSFYSHRSRRETSQLEVIPTPTVTATATHAATTTVPGNTIREVKGICD